MIQRDTHEPLITDDEAKTILAAVELRRVTRAKPSAGTYLLSGLLVSPDGRKWHSDGEGFYRAWKGRRVKAAEVDAAVLGVIVRDISGDAFAQAVLDHYIHQSKPATRDTTLAKLAARVVEIDRQSEKLAWLLGETSPPAALLRALEKLEVERDSIASQLEVATDDEKTRAMLRKLSIGDVKRFLAGIASQMEADPELLKEALTGIIENVLLDPATLDARVSYKIADLTGDKVASPRGFEPRYLP